MKNQFNFWFLVQPIFNQLSFFATKLRKKAFKEAINIQNDKTTSAAEPAVNRTNIEAGDIEIKRKDIKEKFSARVNDFLLIHEDEVSAHWES